MWSIYWSFVKFIVGCLAIVFLCVLMALGLIWSLNTLFFLSIPYTGRTVLAAHVLYALIVVVAAAREAVRR